MKNTELTSTILGLSRFCIVIENFDVYLRQKEGPQEAMELHKRLSLFKNIIELPFSTIYVTSKNSDIGVPQFIVSPPSDQILSQFIKEIIHMWTLKY
jgi:hypothetical protein